MSAAGVFPVIPGVDLAQNQKDEMWSICLTLAVLGVLFVFLRAVSRWTQSKKVPLALDDYLILPALIFALGTAACALEGLFASVFRNQTVADNDWWEIATKYGGGRHLATLTLKDFIGLYKVVYAYTFFWIWALTFTKLSILAFYKRVFGPSIQLWICTALTIGYFISITVSWATACRPISFLWMKWITPEAPGYCFNIGKFDLANAISNLLIDVAVLCVPLPTIAKLRMPLKQKFGVAGVLLLGSFVSVATIIRLTEVVHMNKNATDISWSMGAVFVWSCVEPFVGIFCACLPTYPPLIRLIWRKFHDLPSTVKSASAGLSYGKNKSATGGVSVHDDRDDTVKGFRSARGIRRLGSDDELGLTNEISGPMSPGMNSLRRPRGKGKGLKGIDEEMGLEMGAISVRKEVDWSSVSDGNGGSSDSKDRPMY